jgi:hypothetical protein
MTGRGLAFNPVIPDEDPEPPVRFALSFPQRRESRIIILEDLPPTIIERYDHGKTFAQIQLKHDRRIFVGLVGKEPIIDPQRFGETVAINRGAHCKVFTNLKDGLDWHKRNDLN